MRRAASIIALLLALVALQGSAAAPAEPTQFRSLTGQGSISAENGCIQTFMTVFVVHQRDHQPPGGPTAGTSASVDVVQEDTCAGTSVSAYGSTGDVSFSADNQLRYGEMTATFTSLQDSATGEVLPPLSMVVTWEGTEDLTVSSGHDKFESVDGMVNQHETYSERVGTMTVTATGAVSVEASGFGFLGLQENWSVRVP